MSDNELRIAVEQMGMDIADIRKKLAVMCETWNTWRTTRCDDNKELIDRHCLKISDLEINQAKIATRSAVITGLIIGAINAGVLILAILQFKAD